ncbi:MAG: hypothetical protein WCL08_06210 [Verrucomicrobiota bacterium]|jgi:hypothetical protein
MSYTRLFPLTFLLLAQTVLSAIASDAPRERISLDAGWRFTKGDSPDVLPFSAYVKKSTQ